MEREGKRAKPHVLDVRAADNVWGVTTLSPSAGDSYMRKPCRECPWRKVSLLGRFPPEAYRLSATTASDASLAVFACHMAGSDAPSTCAGFLLSNAENNASVRISAAIGELDMNAVSSDVELYASYREMAVANGVAEDDPALAECRANWE